MGIFMDKHSRRQLDVYSELCPASSATIIGAGLVAITMGSTEPGLAVVLAGVVVGIAAPLAKGLSLAKLAVRKP